LSRSHWVVRVSGVLPDQPPSEQLSVDPGAGMPVTVGGTVFVGVPIAMGQLPSGGGVVGTGLPGVSRKASKISP